MNARDASGVPAELRELLEVLADLTEPLPRAADGNWNRRREAEGRRESMLRVTIGSLVSTLRIHDQFPGVAGKLLAQDCKRWTEVARERLAEPLGYEPEPEPDEDGAK